MQKRHKDIARVDQESKRTHGWYVRIRFQGEMNSKLFSDKKHGDRDTALEAAITWRNNVEKMLGKKRTDKQLFTVGTSSTRIVGVRLNEKQHRYYVSWITPQGKQGKTSVSIRKHGKKAAFTKACALRHQKEEERLAG